jgi:Cys-tRNA(Pro) deacylase
MSKEKTPVTAAVRELRAHKVEFSDHLYAYEEHGGTAVVKTLVLEDDARRPLIALMHGDLKVSTKELARVIGVKTIAPCSPETANRHSGYLVGGTSPFGTRKPMPVYMESTILELERIYINGGKRGFLVGLDPREVVRVLKPTLVKVGIPND